MEVENDLNVFCYILILRVYLGIRTNQTLNENVWGRGLQNISGGIYLL